MAKKPSYLFVSPHLDDAVLSCGGWISYLADKAEVTVASVFTNAHNSPSSLSIRRFLKECGYNDSEKLFADRRMEDKLANNLMGVKTIHLGFLDGLYRLKPQTIPILSDILPDSRFVYPIFSWQLKRGKVSNHDKQLIDEVGRRVKNLIGPRTIIFAPAAVGYHLDHQIVRMACEQKFPETIFWSDFPYNVWNRQFSSDLIKRGYRKYEWRKNLEQKVELIKIYKTQVNLLFPDRNIPKVPEYYFAKQGVVPLSAAVGEFEPLTEEN